MGQAEPRCHQSMGNLTIWSQKYSLLHLNLIIPGFPFHWGKSLTLAEAKNVGYRGSVGGWMTALVTQELSSMVAVPGWDFFFWPTTFNKQQQKKPSFNKKCWINLLRNWQKNLPLPSLKLYVVLPCWYNKIKWKRIFSIFLSPVC